MAQPYIVPRGDQYTTETGEYFQYTLTGETPRVCVYRGGKRSMNETVIYRDINKDLTKLTLSELRVLARKVGIKDRSKMRKAELLAAVMLLVQFE